MSLSRIPPLVILPLECYENSNTNARTQVRNVLSAALKFATVAKEHQDNNRMIRTTRNTFRVNVKFLLLLLRRRVESENAVTMHLRGILTQLDYNGYFGGMTTSSS